MTYIVLDDDVTAGIVVLNNGMVIPADQSYAAQDYFVLSNSKAEEKKEPYEEVKIYYFGLRNGFGPARRIFGELYLGSDGIDYCHLCVGHIIGMFYHI